ncbi:MAG: hypothetical protein Q9159_004751 [Coniocarpon cinnabarinum]
MATSKTPPRPPKILLFDIGGVLVRSPLTSIAAFEKTHAIPAGYINTAIARSGPNGYWQKLERGEIALNARFFAGFKKDLENPNLWHQFVEERARRTGGTDAAGAWGREYVERLVKRGVNVEVEELFWNMMGFSRETNRKMAQAVRRLKREGKERWLVCALSNTVVFPAGHAFSLASEGRGARTTTNSTNKDAGEKDSDSVDDTSGDIKDLFDVFISSAYVGLRKPEPEIYELALRWCGDAWQERVKRLQRQGKGEGLSEECKAEDFVFLDDIGANLAPARRMGMHTIKVGLEEGGPEEAVRQLERVTGMKLLDEEDAKARL